MKKRIFALFISTCLMIGLLSTLVLADSVLAENDIYSFESSNSGVVVDLSNLQITLPSGTSVNIISKSTSWVSKFSNNSSESVTFRLAPDTQNIVIVDGGGSLTVPGGTSVTVGDHAYCLYDKNNAIRKITGGAEITVTTDMLITIDGIMDYTISLLDNSQPAVMTFVGKKLTVTNADSAPSSDDGWAETSVGSGVWELNVILQYPLYIAGVQIDDTKLTGTGYIYDLESNTLTLENADLHGLETDNPTVQESSAICYYGNTPLIIELKGNNTLTAGITQSGWSTAIFVDGNETSLTIQGSGSLNATSVRDKNDIQYGNAGIYVLNGDLNINVSGTIKATASGAAIYNAGIYLNGNTLTIGKGSTVIATAGSSSTEGYDSNAGIQMDNSAILRILGPETTVQATGLGKQSYGINIASMLGNTPGSVLVDGDISSLIAQGQERAINILSENENITEISLESGNYTVTVKDKNDTTKAYEGQEGVKWDWNNTVYFEMEKNASIPVHTVTYKADDKTVDTIKVDHGKDVSEVPEIPAKEGHTAVWDKDGKNITADTVINAVYTINEYTVTYKADGKTVDTIKVNHGKDVSKVPEIPTKEGHTAVWDKDGKSITADTVINAVYTEIPTTNTDTIVPPSTPDKESSVTPDTGDNSNIKLWFILLFTSAAGILGLTLNELKIHRNNQN